MAVKKDAAKKIVGKFTSDDMAKVTDGSAFKLGEKESQLGKFGSAMRGNWQNAAREEGRSVLRMTGNHAVRGAAWGAVGGGTIEAVQGGSFWDGAKQGALSGSVGWTGYRMGMKGVGAKSMNPFKKEEGLISSGKNLYQAFSKDANVSKQAVAILNQRQRDGVAQSVMNQRKKAANSK